ncbi:MAG TPA: sigma-54 dependent transcriptional regulator [Terracidiphilus sp.]|jgi:DNA-binding NtrC family response regulator|nr:sigma-54 dependent transcriptional regulator [Terracidiphilus sp.]
MSAIAVSAPISNVRTRVRTALVASADRSFRQRLAQILTGLRWQVREVEGGAEAWTAVQSFPPEAVIVDSWLPDLELTEFLKDFRGSFPQIDLVAAGGGSTHESPRGPHRQELLYALRRCQDTDAAAWNSAPTMNNVVPVAEALHKEAHHVAPWPVPVVLQSPNAAVPSAVQGTIEPFPKKPVASETIPVPQNRKINANSSDRLPGLIGNAPCMLEVSRRVRLVASRLTPVLIEGPTGSGKELVAEALHRLSSRSRKPFVALNCAAIPEALLEAELFGHTRGAFTGAVHGRTGRIEAADGGTLFLDEIGEMPLALQSKLLRFVECGELQRVGDNETVKVDVRILAATHRPLAQHAAAGSFRSDLYYRLAVFLIRTPSLADHSEDLPLLVEHFMQKLGREMPVKRVDSGALAKLAAHQWPGNVRELEHVLERAVILAGDEPVLTTREIDFGNSVN